MSATKLKRLVSILCASGLIALTGCSGGTASPGGADSFSVGVLEPTHLIAGNSSGGFEALSVLFDPLVETTADGKLGFVQAESVTTAGDPKVWTIKLRPGAKFHNGESVDAESYARGWNNTAYGPNGYTWGGQLAGIAGWDALNPASGEPTVNALSGLNVIDALTLQVTLSKPNSQFPFLLTGDQLGFYPLPKAALSDLEAYDIHPIGNGPYQMDGDWKHNELIAVKAFPEYAGPRKSSAQHIDFKIYSSAETAYTDVQAGALDLTQVPQTKFNQVQADFKGHVITNAGASVDFLGFPTFDKRFSDVRIRQAISLAIDRDQINKSLYGELYTVADSLLSPAIMGGSTKSCAYCRFDPVEAKRLFQAAGGLAGRMVIAFPGGVGYDDTFSAIANQIRQNLGIDTVAEPTNPYSAFLENLTDKKYDGAFRGHYGGLYPSPQDTLSALFVQKNAVENGIYYQNDAVTKLIEQGDEATEQEKAVDFYQQAEKLAAEDFPVAPLFFNRFPWVTSNRITSAEFWPGRLGVNYGSVTVN